MGAANSEKQGVIKLQKNLGAVSFGFLYVICFLTTTSFIYCLSVKATPLEQLLLVSQNSPPVSPSNIPNANPKPNPLQPPALRTSIVSFKIDYIHRFERNQIANNIIIGFSILLGALIAITGAAGYFKDQTKRWSYPLGLSAAAWLGLTSTSLLSIQKLYNLSDKIHFYPPYIVKTQELIEDFDQIKSEVDLNKVKEGFRKMRAEEAANRPIEISPK